MEKADNLLQSFCEKQLNTWVEVPWGQILAEIKKTQYFQAEPLSNDMDYIPTCGIQSSSQKRPEVVRKTLDDPSCWRCKRS